MFKYVRLSGQKAALAIALSFLGAMALLKGAQAAELAVADPMLSAASEPVIVTFRNNAPLRNYLHFYRSDERGRASPFAWDYLDKGVGGAVQELERRRGFRAQHVFSAIGRGFSARLTAQQIEALRNDPLIASVEPDGIVSIAAQAMPWGIDRMDGDVSSTRAGNGSGSVSGVNIYIVDSGVYKHPDLNVVKHLNFTNDGKNYDCNGHGTHVAGTIAAKDNVAYVVGIAPSLPITGMKVLDCAGNGTTSNVIKAIDWIAANATKPAVVNLSVSGGVSSSLDNAVIRGVSKGLLFTVAAGNNGADACNYSPGRIGTRAGVMTIAATDQTDREASFSNSGSCVDIWAPGVQIVSTRMGGGTALFSGTSMAAPHIVGAAALYLSTYRSASPSAVEAALKSTAVYTGTLSRNGRQIQMGYAGAY